MQPRPKLTPAHAKTLLERIDIAIDRAQSSRHALAEHLGISVQAISNLRRRPGSTLRPERVAYAARFLHCDVFWLCTGEGGDYVPESKPLAPVIVKAPNHTGMSALEVPEKLYFINEIVLLLTTLPEHDQKLAFAELYKLHKTSHLHVARAPAP